MQRQVTAHSGLPPQNGPRVYVLGAGKGHVTAPPPRSQPPARRARMQLNNARPCDRSAHLRMYLGGGSARALGVSCIAIARFGTRGRGRVGAKTPPNPPRNPPPPIADTKQPPLCSGVAWGRRGREPGSLSAEMGRATKQWHFSFFPPNQQRLLEDQQQKKNALKTPPIKENWVCRDFPRSQGRAPTLPDKRDAARASREARSSRLGVQPSSPLTTGPTEGCGVKARQQRGVT